MEMTVLAPLALGRQPALGVGLEREVGEDSCGGKTITILLQARQVTVANHASYAKRHLAFFVPLHGQDQPRHVSMAAVLEDKPLPQCISASMPGAAYAVILLARPGMGGQHPRGDESHLVCHDCSVLSKALVKQIKPCLKPRCCL